MIMAGRGKRFLDVKDEPKKVGTTEVPFSSSEDTPADFPSLLKYIDEIIISDINPSLLINIQRVIKQLFTSREVMNKTLCDLHKKALCDPEFGEKVVIALEQVSNFEVDGALLRGELLSFIQSDFKVKEATFKSDSKTFVNSVMLLGHIFSRFKVCGSPIAILSIALFEYFELLLKGKEEELKTLTKQILINGALLRASDKYELLVQNLRNTLVTKDLNSPSKCWILLAIDFMSNDLRPLHEVIRDFYVKNLGEEYTKLEALIPNLNNQMFVTVPSNSTKGQDSTSPKNKNINLNSSKTPGFTKDLPKRFSDMNIKPDFESKGKVQSPHGKSNKKGFWKSGESGRGNSGHDDRFEKEENYYGAQKPRQPKSENQRNKFNDV